MRALALLSIACVENELEKVVPPEEEGLRELVSDTDAVDFGVLADLAPITRTIRFDSVGDEPVAIEDVYLSGSGAYTIAWTRPRDPVAPGDSLDVAVTYTPTTWEDAADLVVENDGVEPSLLVPLTGAGTFPAIAVDPGSLSFQSEWGEPVDGTVTVTSVGTADLVLSSLYVDGEQFSATSDVPVTLAPGEATTIDVTYTPEVAGESVTGKLWITTNTTQGFAIVPLEASLGPECIGLGEAWDRGLVDARTSRWGSELRVENLGADEICVDYWYVWRAVDSQDLGAGDMQTDFGDDYPLGSISLGVGDAVDFPYGEEDEAWWCMEQSQQTQPNKVYTFTGGYVPEPLMSYMNAMDQDGSWAWQLANPVIIAARGTNYVEVAESGGTATVTLRPYNMGGLAGDAVVVETVPAGFAVSDVTGADYVAQAGDDGSTSLTFSLWFDERQERSTTEDTIYDQKEISYTLHVPACSGRQVLEPMTAVWEDGEGEVRRAYANPLVVNCL
ncbi:MAG: choice-of-anchor D domain-containing protein [Myxococcota bacterium]